MKLKRTVFRYMRKIFQQRRRLPDIRCRVFVQSILALAFSLTALTVYMELRTDLPVNHLFDLMSYGRLLWGNAADIHIIFVLQKRGIRAIYKLGPRVSLRDKLKEINIIYTYVEAAELELKLNLEQDKGSGCSVSRTDPFSPEVMQFDQKLPKFVCTGEDWVECQKSKCMVKHYILTTLKHVRCTYSDILYVNDNVYTIGAPQLRWGYEVYTLRDSDQVKVSCLGKKHNINDSEVLSTATWWGYKFGFRPINVVNTPPERGNEVDVLILAFKSASHNGFVRKMPRCYHLLQNELGAVILKSVIGESGATLFPLLTGKSQLEIMNTSSRIVMQFSLANFIFKAMELNGYRTALYQDFVTLSTYQSRLSSFHVQPAHHTIQTVEKAAERLRKHDEDKHCIGSIPYHVLMLNLTYKLFNLPGKHFCFTFICGISQNNFNMISNAEDDVFYFLSKFREEGKLNNTLLIVMGDHGDSDPERRLTDQGRIEERLPFMAIVLPENLKRSRPDALKALKHNVDVMTTPFDIHATVLDAVGLNDKINNYRIPGSKYSRAMTVLRPIPKSRSCSDAGVLPRWCACAFWSEVSQADLMYKRVANVLAEYIDNITSNNRDLCMNMWMISIISVRRHGPTIEQVQKEKKLFGLMGSKNRRQYYWIRIAMNPGWAIYDGQVMYQVKQNVFNITRSSIFRIDDYIDQSYCVRETQPHLSIFCYCLEYEKHRILLQNKEEETPPSSSQKKNLGLVPRLIGNIRNLTNKLL